MKIITKYYFKNIIKYFFITATVLLIITSAADLISLSDEIYSSKTSFKIILNFIIINNFINLYEIIPFVILTCFFLCIFFSKKNNEIYCLYSFNMTIMQFLFPFILFAIIIIIFFSLLSINFIPELKNKKRFIKDIKFRQNKIINYYNLPFSLKIFNNIKLKSDRFDPEKNILYNSTIWVLRKNNLYRIYAEKININKSTWSSRNITVHQILKNDINLIPENSQLNKQLISAKELKNLIKLKYLDKYEFLEEFRLNELLYTYQISKKHNLYTKNFILNEIFYRINNLLSILVLGLIAISICLKFNINSLGMAFIFCIFSSLIYWILISILYSLSLKNILPFYFSLIFNLILITANFKFLNKNV